MSFVYSRQCCAILLLQYIQTTLLRVGKSWDEGPINVTSRCSFHSFFLSEIDLVIREIVRTEEKTLRVCMLSIFRFELGFIISQSILTSKNDDSSIQVKTME